MIIPGENVIVGQPVVEIIVFYLTIYECNPEINTFIIIIIFQNMLNLPFLLELPKS